MNDTRSTRTMCCNNSSDNICEESSSGQMIFGWNKFNGRAWFVLFISFVIWSGLFFFVYKPDNKVNEDANANENHHEHQGHHH